MTIAADRRASVRLAPASAETHCWILDWAVERMITARLLDISLGGALIETNAAIAPGRSLQVGLESASETGWINAEAVRCGRSKRVGIRFTSPCHPEFLVAATCRADPRYFVDTGDEVPDDQEQTGGSDSPHFMPVIPPSPPPRILGPGGPAHRSPPDRLEPE